MLLLLGSPAFAQSSPTYGVGRTPTTEEIRALDISIGPTGEELPPGRGTAKEGAEVFVQKGCVGCHGEAGIGGLAPALKSKKGQDVPIWERERILPLRAPFATTVWVGGTSSWHRIGVETTLRAQPRCQKAAPADRSTT
jgi:cytochrome c